MEVTASSYPELDLTQVECRGYRDTAGLQPGSAPFTAKSPAEVSTNLFSEKSILCYVTTVAEAEGQ